MWEGRGQVDLEESLSHCQQKSYGKVNPDTLTWNVTRHITILASYVHFFAGPFLKETPPGKDMDYVACWVDYTF